MRRSFGLEPVVGATLTPLAVRYERACGYRRVGSVTLLTVTTMPGMAHLLSLLPYDKVPRPKVAIPGRATEDEDDDEAPLRRRRFVPERY
jgi:hypothetical protein